jgi:hypothetical protein
VPTLFPRIDLAWDIIGEEMANLQINCFGQLRASNQPLTMRHQREEDKNEAQASHLGRTARERRACAFAA